MSMITPEDYREILPKLWTRETSAYPGQWAPDCPQLGQGYVTAALAQQLFGGEILYAGIKRAAGGFDPHAFNRLADGSIVDFCGRLSLNPQPNFIYIKPHGCFSTATYLGSTEDTTVRLAAFAQKFDGVSPGTRPHQAWVIVSAQQDISMSGIESAMTYASNTARTNHMPLGLIVGGDWADRTFDMASRPFTTKLNAVLVTGQACPPESIPEEFIIAHGIDCMRMQCFEVETRLNDGEEDAPMQGRRPPPKPTLN